MRLIEGAEPVNGPPGAKPPADPVPQLRRLSTRARNKREAAELAAEIAKQNPHALIDGVLPLGRGRRALEHAVRARPPRKIRVIG